MVFFRIGNKYFDEQKYEQRITPFADLLSEELMTFMKGVGFYPLNSLTFAHDDLDIIVHVSIIPRNVRETT